MRGLSFDPGVHCAFTVADHIAPGARATLVHRGILERGDDNARVAEAFGLMSTYHPDVVFVETVSFVVNRKGFSPSMAGHLHNAGRLGARIYQLALDHGFRAEEISAEEWRRWIVGKATAENNEIAPVVRLRFGNWPEVSNNHERDAGGLCIYGLERELRLSLGLPRIVLANDERKPLLGKGRKRKMRT